MKQLHFKKNVSIFSQQITLDNKFQIIVCVCDEYVINLLFASMKLEN